MLRWVLAAVHLLSLAVGVGSNVVRYLALRNPSDPEQHKLLLTADNVGGIVSITWIGSGLWRAFGGLEKGSDYYLSNPFFQAKLGLIGVALLFEIWPMVVFIQWRYAARRGEALDLRRVPLFRKLILGEMVLTVLAIFCASAAAQGLGSRPSGEGYAAVKGVFLARCVSCHGEQTRTAGLSLERDARGSLVERRSSQWPELALVAPGAPDASLLIQKLRGTQQHGTSMPPAGRLPDAELAVVEAWVKGGAR